MKKTWVLIFIQSFLIGYLCFGSKNEQKQPYETSKLESLRLAACNSALLTSKCLDFQNPEESKCSIGFSFAALIDIKLRFTDFTNYFLPPSEAKHNEELKTKTQMLETLAYSFSTGRAAEFRVSKDLFELILETLKPIENWRTIGGNGAVMSFRAAHEGCKAYLAAPLTEEMTAYFPYKIKFLNTLVPSPDLHIILEYREGETWGKYSAPRSNRFYMNHDTQNTNPGILESAYEINNIDVFVIGGLQLIENTETEDLFLSKALDIANHMKTKNIKTHIEMGDFHSYNYFKKLQTLLSIADSIGMNEQELGILLCHLKKIKFTGYPSKAPIKKYLDDLTDLIGELSANGYLASRIHLHTIYSQVICSDHQWSDSLIAAARSSILAGQFACNNTDLQYSTFEFYQGEDWDNDTVSKCWEVKHMQCCLALVPTCLNVAQVSGLGDNISAIGLAYHKINKN